MDRKCGCCGSEDFRNFVDGFEIYACNECDGIDAQVSSHLCKNVLFDMDLPMQAESKELRYFNVLLDDKTHLHGWFDVKTMRVVQYG